MIKTIALAVVLLAACGSSAQDETPAADTTSAAKPAPEPGPVARDSNVVSFGGILGFVPGMSLTDARAAMPGLKTPAAPMEGCDYASVGAGENKLTFLVVDDKLARVDVASAAYTTDRGIGVGDSEDQVKAAYQNVVVEPHKYTNGRYLIVNNPADTMIALVFETDSSSNVTQYRLGIKPVVQWVEGCS